MPIKAVTYNYPGKGGEIVVEDGDMGSCMLVSSRTASINRLRRLGAAKLRTMAHRLEVEATRRKVTDGIVEHHPAPGPTT